MSEGRTSPQGVPTWSRIAEWSVLVAVIVVLVLVFVRQMRVMQGQAELAAVRSTLGALRTALVIEHLRRSVVAGGRAVAPTQRNPFELLQHPPVTYRSAMTAAAAEVVPAGSWLFEPDCGCVGYLPLYAEWFESPSGAALAWFELSGAPGPLQLTAKEAYAWQGQPMN